VRIIIPILGFARAGGYRVLSELANAWIASGHHVSFLSPDSSEPPYFPTNAAILWVDRKGLVLSERKSQSKPSGMFHLVALYRGLNAVANQFDIVLANHSLTAWPVALSRAGAAKKAYYIQAYEPEYYLAKRSVKNWILAVISAGSYHLPLSRIVNSAIYFRYRNLRASTYVPPGLDLSIFTSTSSPDDLSARDQIRIGCIGRHEAEKGTIYALQAFEELHRKDSRYHLRIAYGNLPSGWMHPASEVVVPANDLELAAFYRSVDILLAPGTVQHGAPHYPVLEAGACGTSVVTTGYMAATTENSWLVDNRSVSSIVSAVRCAATDHRIRVSKTTQFLQDIKPFAWPAVAERLLDTLKIDTELVGKVSHEK